ncbi:MAG: hypothetical protein KJ622_01125 [Alphaproteobacteria bacterium]|nr:hypothetical protein [Alphaproteobacteria bacterium]
MFKRFLSTFAIFMLASSAWIVTSESAQAQRWVRLAQHQIDVDAKDELIDLGSAEGSFVGFQLRARRGSIAIEQISLKFSDDTGHESPAPFSLRSGERTRVFSREDNERFPVSLRVTYQDNARNSRRAMLEVWGLQTREGRNNLRPEKQMPVPPPPPRIGQREVEASGAILITAKTAGREAMSETLDVAENIGKFTRLTLATRSTAASVERLTVKFADGSEKAFAVSGVLQPNTSTPWFEIDGSKFIKEVELAFAEKTSLTAPVRFELYGKPTTTWLQSGGDGGRFNDGWVLIGAQTAGFVGFDNDVISLADHGDGFSEIRVNVDGRSVTLNQLRIVYENGEEDIVPVRARIDSGDTYGPISLRSGEKIKEVQARYRTRIIEPSIPERNTALVQVWAKR